MKKYFNNCIIVLLVGIVIIGILNNYILGKVDFEIEKYKKVPNNLKIINLGSSHTQNGIYYPQNLSAYNLGLAAQPLYYDFEILKKYSKKLEKKAIIIIPISIFTFYHGNDFMNLNDRYYNIVDYNQVFNKNYNSYFSNLIFGYWKDKANMKILLNYFKKCILEKKVLRIEKQYKQNLSQKEKEVQLNGKVKHHLSGITDKLIPQNPEISKNKLLEILNYTKQNNLIPVFITTPQTNLYNSKIVESIYKERIYDHLEDIKNKSGQNILYLDYSHDSRFENNLEYFYDVDHLNEKGAKLFTEIMLKDLSEQIKIKF
ncbi:MAG: hypothetical protein ACRDAQ_03810 [Cetobacterium sp.]